MTADGPRIEELRRRVDKVPAYIAFAPLAEELRRTGRQEEAIFVCRAGLEYHPTYLSARLTLGRSLLELHRYPEARAELLYVLNAAPDNLIALKCLSELESQTGARPHPDTLVTSALPEPQHRPDPVPADPALEELEAWHARIQADRARRAGESAPHNPPR